MSHKRSHSRSRSQFGELTSTGDLLKIYGTIQQSNEQNYSQLLKQYNESKDPSILDKLKQKRSDMKKMLHDTSAICQMSIKKLYTPTPLETITEATSDSEVSSDSQASEATSDSQSSEATSDSRTPSDTEASSDTEVSSDSKYKPTLPSVR